MDISPYLAGDGDWAWCPTEYRDTGLYDADGKRIGFEIQRSLSLRAGVEVPHNRWVAVTKDGQWMRNDTSTFHATWEQAEEEVERKISRSTARYKKLASKRGDVVAAPDAALGLPVVVNTSRAGRQQRTGGDQGCLIVLSIVVAVSVGAVRCLARM
jgi:hypothetical protein